MRVCTADSSDSIGGSCIALLKNGRIFPSFSNWKITPPVISLELFIWTAKGEEQVRFASVRPNGPVTWLIRWSHEGGHNQLKALLEMKSQILQITHISIAVFQTSRPHWLWEQHEHITQRCWTWRRGQPAKQMKSAVFTVKVSVANPVHLRFNSATYKESMRTFICKHNSSSLVLSISGTGWSSNFFSWNDVNKWKHSPGCTLKSFTSPSHDCKLPN